MILYPAIDLKNGQCVRLYQGDMQQATVYNDSPAAQAKLFQDQGFQWLHLVDLDGAFAGESRNGEAVKNILAATNIPAQLGGGIRTLQHIEQWLSAGIQRVILGTVALTNPDLVRQACKKFPGKIVIGIDAKNGMVATEGWDKVGETSAIELAQKLENSGAAAIVFTDIARDGTGQGVNVTATASLSEAVTIPIIASGGIAGLNDLTALKKHSNIKGAILGRSLYDKSIIPEAALKLAA